MAVRIVYKAAAEAEVEEAYGAYATIQRGLGVDFFDAPTDCSMLSIANR